MAVKAVNDTAGPDGLIPTLLVFGAFPRLSNMDPPAPTVTQRAAAIKGAMAEVAKCHAQRKVTDALRQRNGPRTDPIHNTPIGSDVLVWRTHLAKWTGPFKLLSIQGETCNVNMPHGSANFQTTSVKPYLQQKDDEFDPANNNNDENNENHDNLANDNDEPRRNPVRDRRLPSRYEQFTSTTPPPNFEASRRKELDGLMERGVFKVVAKKDIPTGTRIFGSRFVDQVKNKGTVNAYEKSRLVVQAYNDDGKRFILTQAPTIQRASQRLILALALMIPGLDIYIRDISQAYTQSTTRLSRNVFIKAPTEMGLESGNILQVVLPLYGIPEAGTHWFKTYHDHHTIKLHMISSTFDPCLLYNNHSTAIIGLQTDDTLIAADNAFMVLEQEELEKAKFLAKPYEALKTDGHLEFNGLKITLLPDGLQITQEKQASNIMELDQASFAKEQYVAQRARGAYLATVSQPQAAFPLSYAAQIINPTINDAKYLNKCLIWQRQNAAKGLKFVKLDTGTVRLVVFTDASFANNRDQSSQIGYVIILADGYNNANIIHWQSVKCKRVTRSVLASELYALSLGFDVASTIKSTLTQILSGLRQGNHDNDDDNITIPMVLCIDSKSLYDCLVKLGITQEKRLMVDLMCLRQSYERREITEIIWIKGPTNPADAMTKDKPCPALRRIINSNKIEVDVDS